MRERIIYGLLLFAAVFAAGEVFAQKYPERRMARDGNRAYSNGDYESAETEYRRALETNPELKEAWFNLGNAAFKQEKGEEAAKIFLSIASDSTAHPSMLSAANYNLGNTMLAGQKIEDAIELYKQALRIDPTDMEAKYNLAYARKLLQNQPPEDQNQDNQDQNQDQNQDNQDQNQDQSDQNQDQNDQDQNDQNSDQDQNQDNQDQNEPPKSDQGGGGQDEASIDPQDAEHMLDAMQDEEDKTRDKMQGKEVPTVGRSGKNW